MHSEAWGKGKIRYKSWPDPSEFYHFEYSAIYYVIRLFMIQCWRSDLRNLNAGRQWRTKSKKVGSWQPPSCELARNKHRQRIWAHFSYYLVKLHFIVVYLSTLLCFNVDHYYILSHATDWDVCIRPIPRQLIDDVDNFKRTEVITIVWNFDMFLRPFHFIKLWFGKKCWNEILICEKESRFK